MHRTLCDHHIGKPSKIKAVLYNSLAVVDRLPVDIEVLPALGLGHGSLHVGVQGTSGRHSRGHLLLMTPRVPEDRDIGLHQPHTGVSATRLKYLADASEAWLLPTEHEA